jgi:hypothetical protein
MEDLFTMERTANTKTLHIGSAAQQLVTDLDNAVDQKKVIYNQFDWYKGYSNYVMGTKTAPNALQSVTNIDKKTKK